MASLLKPENFGADPARIKWTVVRGDTSSIRVDFLENDETTQYSTTGWTYLASAYNSKSGDVDELSIESGSGYVIISIDPEISAEWGTGYSATVAELAFDLQVTTNDGTVWTPLIGNIAVLADISSDL